MTAENPPTHPSVLPPEQSPLIGNNASLQYSPAGELMGGNSPIDPELSEKVDATRERMLAELRVKWNSFKGFDE